MGESKSILVMLEIAVPVSAHATSLDREVGRLTERFGGFEGEDEEEEEDLPEELSLSSNLALT
jgi:hypothetical protein